MDVKKSGTFERERKGLKIKPNGRSADFIIPSFAIGCELACSYCYVARHRAFGNPLELMINRDAIWESIKTHWQQLPPKPPNQIDPQYWVYDIGESTDCLTPKVVETTRWFVQQFLSDSGAKPTFATKVARPDVLDDINAYGPARARVRVSLMPQTIADVVEYGTSRMDKRIAAIDGFLAKGYEVHVTFSPVIAYKGWYHDYQQLMRDLDRGISPAAKAQLKAEVIFLTHHEALHQSNLNWVPEAEELLWTPQWQELKTTQQGDSGVVRYKAFSTKKVLEKLFRQLMAEELPYCPIRYMF
jgi:DNA repair photolyase